MRSVLNDSSRRPLAVLGVVLICVSWCEGQTGKPPAAEAPEVEATRRFQAHAKEIAAAHVLHIGQADGRKVDLLADPILRWANPLGGKRAHGEVFLWTDRGRPAVVLSLNEYTDAKGALHEEHEWHSLASQAVTSVGPDGWAPTAAGIAFQPLPDAEPPADSPARRLRQMRELAARFSGEKTTRAKETRDLRLLPQPAFRYEIKEQDQNVLDGALFALVEANDPEVFLILQAQASGPAHAWHYALARMESLRVAVAYRGQRLWEAPALPANEVYNRTDKPYAAFLK